MDERGRVVIITRPPGSGKTTVARIVANRFDRAVHLESDDFFHFIRSGYIEPWMTESHRQNEVVNRVVADAATSYTRGGYFTIVDGIFIPGWFFEPLHEHLRSAGLGPMTAILRPSLAVCLARAGNRASRSLTDHAVLDQLWHGFEDPRMQMVSVPDLTKFVHPPRCNTELKRLGLTLEVLEVVRGSRDPSTPQVLVVRRQSPRAGTKLPRGSSVKVWVVAEPRPSSA